MDKLLDGVLDVSCETCAYKMTEQVQMPHGNCWGCGLSYFKYEPNDTIKEIDRLIKLGRRYDTDTEINRVKECRWAKEVK